MVPHLSDTGDRPGDRRGSRNLHYRHRQHGSRSGVGSRPAVVGDVLPARMIGGIWVAESRTGAGCSPVHSPVFNCGQRQRPSWSRSAMAAARLRRVRRAGTGCVSLDIRVGLHFYRGGYQERIDALFGYAAAYLRIDHRSGRQPRHDLREQLVQSALRSGCHGRSAFRFNSHGDRHNRLQWLCTVGDHHRVWPHGQDFGTRLNGVTLLAKP